MAQKKASRKKRSKSAEPNSRGLKAAHLGEASPPADVQELVDSIGQDSGTALCAFRDPLGGHWQVLASIPIDKIQPTPYQRDLSDGHVQKLTKAIDKLDRFLDPIIAVRSADGIYWTPNGHHRTAAMRQLGARSLAALVIPDDTIAYQILALNTEKAHNLRERALEVIRMAQELAQLDPRPERDFELEFEEAPLLTLGLCYQNKGRFAGSAYHPVLRRIDDFLSAKLPDALETRHERAEKVLMLEHLVNEAVANLKRRGLESPYLKNFVVARINPLRFKRGATADFDETMDKMIEKAENFDVGKVKSDQLARSGGTVES